MIGSREQAVERTRRDAALRRAALQRLQRICAEIDEVTEQRVEAWCDLSYRPSKATADRVGFLSDRLTTLWSEARKMRACVRHGERGLILERAQSEHRAVRGLVA